MNIRPRPGKLCADNSELPLTQARFATPKLKVATGVRVPASGLAAFGITEGHTRAMPICRRREKVFGPGRAVPLDRNAKARIAAYARARSVRNRQPRQRADHQGLPGRAGGAAVGLPQQPHWRLLPELREDRTAAAECARSTVPRR